MAPVRLVSAREMELLPSITAPSAAVAVILAPDTVKTPVEYRPGASRPDVTIVPPLTTAVPPPRSVATAAELAPAVVMRTLVSETEPPPLAIAPCAYWAVALMVAPDTATDEPEP